MTCTQRVSTTGTISTTKSSPAFQSLRRECGGGNHLTIKKLIPRKRRIKCQDSQTQRKSTRLRRTQVVRSSCRSLPRCSAIPPPDPLPRGSRRPTGTTEEKATWWLARRLLARSSIRTATTPGMCSRVLALALTSVPTPEVRKKILAVP